MSPRPAVAADRAAVEDIVRLAYTPYIERIGRPPGPMGDDYGALIAQGRVHVLEDDGVVRALLVLLPQPGALLDNIAVHPAAQGQGLGRILLEFAERSAREQGYAAIELYTNEAMTENLGLYARIGYRETHRATTNGLKRVYMAKALA